MFDDDSQVPKLLGLVAVVCAVVGLRLHVSNKFQEVQRQTQESLDEQRWNYQPVTVTVPNHTGHWNNDYKPYDGPQPGATAFGR